MNNKVLVNLIVPSINAKFEVYIPINETISKIYSLLSKSILELSDDSFELETGHYFLDPDEGVVYRPEDIIRNTNIKNSKKIILI